MSPTPDTKTKGPPFIFRMLVIQNNRESSIKEHAFKTSERIGTQPASFRWWFPLQLTLKDDPWKALVWFLWVQFLLITTTEFSVRLLCLCFSQQLFCVAMTVNYTAHKRHFLRACSWHWVKSIRLGRSSTFVEDFQRDREERIKKWHTNLWFHSNNYHVAVLNDLQNTKQKSPESMLQLCKLIILLGKGKWWMQKLSHERKCDPC